MRAASRAIDESGRTSWSASAATSSAPAYLAARRRGVPIVVHEANARPGVANRLGARLTRDVAVAFPGTPLRGAQVLGMPLRRQITQLDRDACREAAPQRLRPGTGPDHAAGHRRLAGGAAAQRHLRRRRGRSAAGRRPGAARLRPGQGGGRRRRARAGTPALRRAATTWTGWSSATPPPTPWSAGPAPVSVCEVTSLGLPAALRAAADRQRRAAAERPAGGRGRRRTAGGGLRLHPGLGARHADPAATGRAAAGRDGHGRRRGSGSGTATSALADMVEGAAKRRGAAV